MRDFLATLLLSQGVPMICGGDEIGRTQRGNNNAYCQDNELSWVHWDLDPPARALLEFTRGLIELRHRHPALRRQQFFFGRHLRGSEVKDLSWFRPDGKEMTEEDWNTDTWCLGLRLAGDAIADVDTTGNRVADDTFLILLNAHHAAIPFVLPAHHRRVRWQLVLDTGSPRFPRRPLVLRGGARYDLGARTLALFRVPGPGD